HQAGGAGGRDRTVSPALGMLVASRSLATRRRGMNEILSGGGVAERRRAGGRFAPRLPVGGGAVVCSGVLSADPEPHSNELLVPPAAAPIVPAAAEALGAASTAPVDDQGDFVEFGFDSQFGAVAPKGSAVSRMPAGHPGESRQSVRPM